MPYCSVDLRNSQYKLAPVDTNLFPAGFNNLHENNIIQAVNIAKKILDYNKNRPNLMIIPENHTSNMFYFENLAVLKFIFQQAGYHVRIGSLSDDVQQRINLTLASGRNLTLEPIIKKNNLLLLEQFQPDWILLNHDLSEGVPEQLQRITQTIVPSVDVGWWSRKKSAHFKHYETIASDFASEFSLDPWLINPMFDVCNDINFSESANEILIAKAENLLAKIHRKYQEYHINLEPYIVIKPNSGTYGMGILTLSEPEKLRQLNRKQRTKMMSMKNNQKIDQVIIQEGIYTVDRFGENKITAEPVIYMIQEHIIGGFYRTHPRRAYDDNLNAPGMIFEPVDIFQCDLFKPHQIIAQLAFLAALKELP